MRNGILVSFDDSLDVDTFYSQMAERLKEQEVQQLFGAGQVILDLGNRDWFDLELTRVADIFSQHGLTLQRIIARPEASLPLEEREKGKEKKRGRLLKAWPPPESAHPCPAEQNLAGGPKPKKVDETAETREESWLRSSEGSEEGNTLLIQRNLRSGQTVEYHGNIVIMGDVNPGAEVIAGGNIIVLGSFRGIAHAGASGDETSTITAFRLRPTQLRIAGHITRPPDDDESGLDIPEIARIREGVVVIERY
ncbi:MAG: septum site-determining protein MinC [Syntrophomonadaceae bacterium]|nr:septum site-determining protein MinC [Syntrophomonadaceae bacterium]